MEILIFITQIGLFFMLLGVIIFLAAITPEHKRCDCCDDEDEYLSP